MQIFVRDKKFYKTLVAFALPIAAQQLITVGVNMADNIMLGQLGEVSMSGATLANNFITIFQIMCMGLGMGASVLTSRYFGMNEKASLKKAVNLMYRLLFSVASFFVLATALIPSQIMRMYTPEQDVIKAGVGYLLISIPCYYLNGYALTTSLVLRSVGKAMVPLISSVCSFFINIFCNWVFIFGHLGAPKMGVNGAALGTLIARIVEFSVTMGYLFFKDECIRMKLRDLFMNTRDLKKEYIRICIPVLVSDTLLGLGNSVAAIIVGHLGSVFVSANAITSVTMQLATVVIQGISQASCTITGITLGEGKKEKAKQQGITFAAIGILIGIIGCGIIFLLRGPIINAYKIKDETRAVAYQLMDSIAVVILFQSANSILTKGVLRGGGDTKFLMVADIVFLWVASIPLGALTGFVLRLEPFWVSIFLRFDHFIKAIWCLFRLKSGKWIKNIKTA